MPEIISNNTNYSIQDRLNRNIDIIMQPFFQEKLKTIEKWLTYQL